MSNSLRYAIKKDIGIQNWNTYPKSPVLVSNYPFQIIVDISAQGVYLWTCKGRIFKSGTTFACIGEAVRWVLFNGAWEDAGHYINPTNIPRTEMVQANYDTYTTSAFTVVDKPKTTVAEQDNQPGIVFYRA